MYQYSSPVSPGPWSSLPIAVEADCCKSSISAASEAATFGPLLPLLPPLPLPLPLPYQGRLLLIDWKSKEIFQIVPGWLMNHTALLADGLFFLIYSDKFRKMRIFSSTPSRRFSKRRVLYRFGS